MLCVLDQVFDRRIGDSRAADSEHRRVFQLIKFCHSCIRDWAAVVDQLRQFVEFANLFQPRISQRKLSQSQGLEIFEVDEFSKTCICYLGLRLPRRSSQPFSELV